MGGQQKEHLLPDTRIQAYPSGSSKNPEMIMGPVSPYAVQRDIVESMAVSFAQKQVVGES